MPNKRRTKAGGATSKVGFLHFRLQRFSHCFSLFLLFFSVHDQFSDLITTLVSVPQFPFDQMDQMNDTNDAIPNASYHFYPADQDPSYNMPYNPSMQSYAPMQHGSTSRSMCSFFPHSPCPSDNHLCLPFRHGTGTPPALSAPECDGYAAKSISTRRVCNIPASWLPALEYFTSTPLSRNV